jgi:hypothetical protein
MAASLELTFSGILMQVFPSATMNSGRPYFPRWSYWLHDNSKWRPSPCFGDSGTTFFDDARKVATGEPVYSSSYHVNCFLINRAQGNCHSLDEEVVITELGNSSGVHYCGFHTI